MIINTSVNKLIPLIQIAIISKFCIRVMGLYRFLKYSYKEVIFIIDFTFKDN